jgi:hypothetical protein
MKTSNKLLICLVTVIVLGLVIVNVVLYIQVKHKNVIKTNTQINIVTDSVSSISDSIAMETAIGNE